MRRRITTTGLCLGGAFALLACNTGASPSETTSDELLSTQLRPRPVAFDRCESLATRVRNATDVNIREAVADTLEQCGEDQGGDVRDRCQVIRHRAASIGDPALQQRVINLYLECIGDEIRPPAAGPCEAIRARAAATDDRSLQAELYRDFHECHAGRPDPVRDRCQVIRYRAAQLRDRALRARVYDHYFDCVDGRAPHRPINVCQDLRERAAGIRDREAQLVAYRTYFACLDRQVPPPPRDIAERCEALLDELDGRDAQSVDAARNDEVLVRYRACLAAQGR